MSNRIRIQEMSDDPQQARYLRRRRKEIGDDEEEDNDEEMFRTNFQQALKQHSKGTNNSSLEKQIEYFGNAIEPFNMRQQEAMGRIDQDGFFLFKPRTRNNDPWLDSIHEGDQQLIDTLKKKVKEQQRFQNVYAVDQQILQAGEQQQDRSNTYLNQQTVQKQQNNKEKEQMSPSDMRFLLASMLPKHITTNKYLKELKKDKRNQEYDRIMVLCNKYIEMTNDYAVLSKMKEELEDEEEEEDKEGEKEEEEEKVLDWDDDEEQGQPIVQDDNKYSNYKLEDNQQPLNFHENASQNKSRSSSDNIFEADQDL